MRHQLARLVANTSNRIITVTSRLAEPERRRVLMAIAKNLEAAAPKKPEKPEKPEPTPEPVVTRKKKVTRKKAATSRVVESGQEASE